MQVLTLKQVKANARKYFRARRLTAQHPDPDKRLCIYKMGEYRCAIGASFTKKTLAKLDELDANIATGVSLLHQRGIITMSPSEQHDIFNIQSAHDNWAMFSRNRQYKDEISKARLKFGRLVNLK